jgi:hypothetical protein
MRVPLDKVYRAFPELDRFSDDACRGFVRQAVRRHRLSQIGSALLGLAMGAIVLVFWALLCDAASALVPRSSAFWDLGPGMPLLAAFWITGAVLALVTVLMMRDHCLRTTIARQLVDTRCPSCNYSMLGLGVVSGVVICPECGLARRLDQTGLSPADLMQRPGAPEDRA